MRRRRLVVASWVLLALARCAVGRAQVEEHPGYFPLEQFGILSDESLSLEINLNKGMLQLVAAALSTEEPEFSELVGGLESIRVRIAPAESFDQESVRRKLTDATAWLAERDWGTMLRIRDAGEVVHVFTRVSDGELQGIAVLAMEEYGDAVLINVVGSLDPERLARLAEVLDIPELGLASGRREPDTEDER
jgi:hypothetical protein